MVTGNLSQLTITNGICSFAGRDFTREALDRSGSPNIERMLDVVEESDDDRGKGRRLLCAACATAITTEANRITVNGGHAHTFTNPHGIEYHIGCFQRAPGCGLAGRATDEFSWFAAHRWQVALCAGCGAHLGWRFRSETRSFYGLIDARLIPEDGVG